MYYEYVLFQNFILLYKRFPRVKGHVAVIDAALPVCQPLPCPHPELCVLDVQAKETLEADTAAETEFYGFLPVSLPVYPEIKGAFLFGLGPLNEQREPALPGRRILVATGDLDYGALNYTNSDNESYLILEDIDHFSIANSYFIEPTVSGKSTRSFAEAQAVVGEVGVAALNSMHCAIEAAPIAGLSVPDYVVEAFGVEEGLEDWISWLPA